MDDTIRLSRTVTDQSQGRRDAIRRTLNRRGIDLKSVAERLDVNMGTPANRSQRERRLYKTKELLEKWFSGGPQLSAEQLDRLVKITLPSPDRKTRENWADAAHRRILRKIEAEPNKPSVTRVLWLLDALRRAEKLRQQLYEASQDGLLVIDRPGEPWSTRWVSRSNPAQPPKYAPDREVFTEPQLQELDLQFQNLMKEIEQRLKRYRWTPTVFCGDFLGLGKMYVWSRKSRDADWENGAVLWLIGQATQGSSGLLTSLILRFRNCRRCQTLFYALTDFQYFCTERCRKKFHSEQVLSTPERRALHAADMRERRRKDKEREASRDAALKVAHKRGR